ncbi:alpha/beta hydrolase [Thiocapsa rosea]|uniref:Esterase/lipase superfamily enzyme n=1 Tax=Thiocapsa rosea TaxID=69360 RepID=A0A495VDR5_9GAMM|nr:alpha/beta hydrolase [Thiocapsa rosea]RKT47536.1 esterase/lipase superfamily enzyme [Thiocapsa rosea]
MNRTFACVSAVMLTVAVISGCATKPRQLMPTPLVYQEPNGQVLFEKIAASQQRPEVDLLFITNRAAQDDPESRLPYGQTRRKGMVFGSAEVRMVPAIDWETLKAQSRLAERTSEVALELGTVKEFAAFPQEPYRIIRAGENTLSRDPIEMREFDATKAAFQEEIRRRLALSPKKEVMLYVHGFNETFATAAFTAAELCHFFGREQVCSFFTWPASSTGNFLISYTTTTESAEYAVDHLKKSLRMIAGTPGVERIQLLAHSRGTAVLLNALRELMIEAIALGVDPADAYRIYNVVLLSPDIDVDIAGQKITGFVSDPDLTRAWPDDALPRLLNGRLSIYASPDDRALSVSRILFRSRNRVGQLRPEDIAPAMQTYFGTFGRIDLITFSGERTDLFGHSYFTTNPKVSSDLVQLIRFGKGPGDPGRDLLRTGPATWEFRAEGDSR